MRTATVLTLALGSTALSLPLAGAAFAQQAALLGSCGELNTMAADAGDTIRTEFADALDIATANDVDACTAYIVRVQAVGGLVATDQATGQTTDVQTDTKSFSASDTIKQTVEITQKAVVDGEVILRMPVPDVTIDQPGAEVQIQDTTATVNIDQAAPTILVRQAPTTITLDMPQPTITIDQPAPEITIIMPKPGVDLTRAQPQVSVNMPEPTVRVTLGEPQVDVQVQARLVDPNSPDAAAAQNNVVSRIEPVEGGTDGAQANVQFTKADPVVRLVDSTEQAQVTVNQAQPQVQFEASEPVVKVNTAGEPNIQLNQVGQPKVVFQEDASADPAQPAQQQQAAAPVADTAAPVATDTAVAPVATDTAAVAPVAAPAARMSVDDTNRMLSEQSPLAGNTVLQTVLVGDLEGLDVATANDENVGSIDRVVQSGGRDYVIVEHGGFLGIGDTQTALPLDRIAIAGDKALLLGLTEEDLAALPAFDYNTGVVVTPDQSIEINNLSQ